MDLKTLIPAYFLYPSWVASREAASLLPPEWQENTNIVSLVGFFLPNISWKSKPVFARVSDNSRTVKEYSVIKIIFLKNH